ncbi:MAG: sortase [Bacilli bacterium]|nr:sortase [Bacilli bacterium]
MLEKIKKLKIKNSTIILIGIVLILIGLTLGLSEYFKEKKNKAFTEMNVLLYENEMPESIQTETEYIEEEVPPVEENASEENSSQLEEIKYDFIGILEIPKINLKNGFLDIGSKYNNVDYNVTVINGSTFPDQENSNLILAAHSGNCYICYFDSLYQLSKGDIAYINYNNAKYSYELVKTYEVDKDGTVAIYKDSNKSSLVLITCTRNSNTKQTVYIFDLINKE